MSLPQNVDLQLYQDSDFSQNFLWANPSASQPLNPLLVNWFDFTNCTASMQIRQAQASTALQYLALTSNAGIAFKNIQPSGYAQPSGLNAFTITITAVQTLSIPAGASYYDLFVVFPASGLRDVYLQGRVFMGPTVTR